MALSRDGFREVEEIDSEEQLNKVTQGNRIKLLSMVPDDIPRVYQYSSQGTPGVQCMVCKANIDIKGKERQYVVRCDECKEATPIRVPPGDKKYIRCVCNCLLICRAGALRLICPRQDCHRILDVGHSNDGTQLDRRGDMVRVACIYCDRNFLFNASDKKLAKCPHCSKRSAVGKGYTFRCAMAYLMIAMFTVVIGAMCVGYTFREAKQQIGYYALYVCLFLASVLLFLRSLYYFLMPVSQVLGPF